MRIIYYKRASALRVGLISFPLKEIWNAAINQIVIIYSTKELH